MVAFGLEIVGVTLSVLGWILDILCCALPMWRVTAFIGTNIVTAQVYWEGIWMNCVVQSTGQMQCKVYDSMLALPMNLQAARALVVVSIILGVLALLVAIVGAKCTNCIEDEATKARVMIASGAAFITAGVMLLIPVSWSANTVILEFYSPVVPEAQKMEIGTMSMGMEIGGIALGIIGWIFGIITCALPMWRVSAFIGANIVTAQVIWEGLWMNCVVQSTGQMQCKVYDSMLALSQDLQASRAMTVISIILAILGVLVSVMGAKCTNCIEDEASKSKVMIVSGILFILAGILQIVPVAWVANQTIRDFYNPLLSNGQQRELGASLYIGFAAAALLIIGGAILCCSCPPKEKKYKPPRMGYSAPRSASGGYDKKDYV
ncbi:claudin-3-like isoform X2 [Xyrauchen texanus]|uniref:claudin-3-like isoform X2 n=2 Tax=Xyrauchen texanus TaxID=154827 RepID=UPI002241B776|nr:claudin-3-like isoform X2 [Xyrauchen texanus]